MPSMLTHKLFAEEAAEKLSFGMTEREKRARLWGAQGPDVLFFHRHMPLHKKGESISEWGHKMHTMPDPAPVIAQLQRCEQEKLGGEVGQAWRQGFLCHYLLDRTCHPFVLAWSKKRNERDPQQPVCYWHQEIEANLDTMMLRRERGLLPQEVSLRRVLPPLEGDAPVIAAHFKKIIFAAFSVEVPLSLILQAMNDAVLGVRLSNDRTGLKHHFFRRMERKKVWRISSRLLPMTEDPDADFANLEHEEWGAQGENEDFFALYDRALEESGHFFRLYACKDAQQVTTGLPFC